MGIQRERDGTETESHRQSLTTNKPTRNISLSLAD